MSERERIRLDEEAVELAALAWLDLAGWRVVSGADVAPDGRLGARSDWRQPILTAELRDALVKLNPTAAADTIDRAITAVLAVPSQDALENNRAFHKLMVEGVAVEVRDNAGETRTEPLWLVARDRWTDNSFLIANQYTVQGDRERDVVRADLVAFVNGLPLGIIEFKSPLEPEPVEVAHRQLENYLKAAPELFRANQVLIVSDGLMARVGTLTAPMDRFAIWRAEAGEVAAGATELETVIRTLFKPQCFLAQTLDLVTFETDRGGVKAKKLAAYHQARAVNRAHERIVRGASPGGDRKGGVVWHTQGSGKSLTMMFLARALQLDPRLANPTILVLTDRNDLDDQLFGTFSHHAGTLRSQPVRATSAAHLRSLLAVDVGGIVFANLQKFTGDNGTHPLLTARSNVIVLVDEAHRTQYGFAKKLVTREDGVRESMGFAAYVRQALPNATFAGFTGTPIAAKDRNTRAVFGEDVDTYNMAQAVSDKATVPIYYTARLAKLHVELNDAERAMLDDLGEELVEAGGASLEAEKAKLSRLDEVIGADERLQLIASDMAEHIDRRFEAMGGGKVMIVTARRQIAVDLHDKLVALRPAWAAFNSEDDALGRIKVVITASSSDPASLQPHRRTKTELETLAERFKNPASGIDIAIVCDMWLTGFDAPPLHTLYIDKPMKGHGLMQAIARVNRVFGAKPGGLVVDYIGIGAELREAMSTYSSGERDQVKLDVEAAVRKLVENLEGAQALLDPAPWQDFASAPPGERLTILKACLEHLLSTDRRAAFLDKAAAVETAFALSAGTEAAANARDAVAFCLTIRANLLKNTAARGERREVVERQIKQLMSRAVVADGILDVFTAAGLDQPDMAVMSDEFLAGVRAMPERSLAVEALRRLLADAIGARERSSIVEARKLTERLDEALRRYHNRAVDSLQVIDELIALARDVKLSASLAGELGLTDEEMAFYLALAENGSAKELMQVNDLLQLARHLVIQIKKSASIDWTRKESVRAKMRLEVRKLLARYGYPPDLQKAAIDLVIEQAEGLARDWDW